MSICLELVNFLKEKLTIFFQVSFRVKGNILNPKSEGLGLESRKNFWTE